MNTDAMWNAIKRGLDGTLDPTLFERCMQDILRDAYPTLAPVVGGGDSGMDGSIATPDGPIPLICTTSEDVIGNFRMSIVNHLNKRGGPSKCVLVTSQRLSPQRRDNIIDAGKDLKVQIIQIHDQEDLIGRLYRNAKWRIELLRIPGNPPPLSCFPLRIRNNDASQLIGRDDDLTWLRAVAGDALIVGQPGSGKTYLHQHMALKGEVVFLASISEADVADAIRDQSPKVIVIDDAHVHLDSVDLLRRLRITIGARYAIHVNSWPHGALEVRLRLGIDPEKVRELELLPQKDIRQLIEQIGITGPDSLLHIIIQQSEGRPGLTSALVDACKQGRAVDVWRGDVLVESLLVDRQLLKDEIDRAVLAAFALGGEHGMATDVVSSTFSIATLELRKRLASLGTGGIIREIDEARVAVSPSALRPVLVRGVFFKGPAKTDFKKFIDAAPRREEAIHVLFGAKQRGADVPIDYLEEEAAALDSESVWEHFGWADSHSANIILERYPEHVGVAASGLLNFHPDRTLELLIATASAKAAKGKFKFDSELGKIARWLCPIENVPDFCPRRAPQLVRNIEKYVVANTQSLCTEVIAHCINVATNPGYSWHGPPPGDPMAVQIRRGVVPLECLTTIMDQWPRLAEIAKLIPKKEWKILLKTVRHWLWPSEHTMGRSIPDNMHDYMLAGAKRMAEALIQLPNCDGLARCELIWLAKGAGFDLGAKCDPLLKLLFSDPDRSAESARREERRHSALRLCAGEMLAEGAAKAVATLAAVERELADFGEVNGGWDRWVLYDELAEKCTNPSLWLHEMVGARMPAGIASRFLAAVSKRDPSNLLAHLRILMGTAEYCGIAVWMILRTSGIDGALLVQALDTFRETKTLNGLEFSDQSISIEAISGLLRHENSAVRGAAALGIWHASDRAGPSADLMPDWSEAVLAMGGDDRENYWLKEILPKYPSIAYEWAKRRLENKENALWEDEGGIRVAAKILNIDQRKTLLGRLMSHDTFDDGWFDALVGDDLELFRLWFRSCGDKHLKLIPLHRSLDAKWILMAEIAFEEGATSDDVGEFVNVHGSHSGPSSKFYGGQIPCFEALMKHSNRNFHRIGENGVAYLRKLIAREEKRERHMAVFGI